MVDDREARLDQIVGDYLADIDAGRAVPPAEFIARHPEFRTDLAEFFTAQACITRLAEPAGTIVLGPGASFAGYEIVSLISRGGIGVVYRARQRSPGREVALKLMSAAALASPRDRARFRLEAEAAARLDHPHIVPVHEVGEVSGLPFLSMRYLDGGNLAADVPRLKSDPRAVAHLLLPIAEAVHFAHQRGILHRDLKPSNVLLDRNRRPYLADFGLARDINAADSPSLTGDLIGTPQYMAPEQALGNQPATVRTDVHGLGALLYACLVGRAPFAGTVVADVLDRVRSSAPAAPRSLNPAVPADLDALCRKCLEKDPADRYASAADVAADLRHFLAGEPVAARPASRPRRAWKWARRHPAVVAGLIVGVALLATAAGSLGWAIARDRAATDLAYEAQMAQVVRQAYQRPAGWTWANRAALERAARIHTTQRNPVELRSELARCLLASDCRPTDAIDVGFPFQAGAVAFSPTDGRAALAETFRHKDPKANTLRVVLTDPAGGPPRTWAVPRGLAWEHRRGRVDRVESLVFSPDECWLVAGLRSGGLHVLDVTGTTGARELTRYSDRVRSLVFRGDYLYVAANDGTVERWRVADWASAGAVKLGPATHCDLTAISGCLLVGVTRPNDDAAGYRLDPELLVMDQWDVPRHAWEAAVPHPGGGLVLVPEPGGTSLRLADADRRIFVRSPPGPVPDGLREPIERVAFDATGQVFALGTEGSSPVIQLHDTASLARIGRFSLDDGVGLPVFDSPRRRFAVPAGDQIALFEYTPGALGCRAGGAVAPIRAFAFRGDGRELAALAVVDHDGAHPEFLTWSLPDPGRGPTRLALPEGDDTYRHVLAASPLLPEYVASFRHNVTRRLRSNGSSELLGKLDKNIYAAAVGPDGRIWLAAGANLHEAKGGADPVLVWTNSPPKDRNGEDAILALAAVSTGLFVGTEDGYTHFLKPGALEQSDHWDLSQRPVTAVALDRACERGASGTSDGHIRVQLLPSGVVDSKTDVHTGPITGLAFVGPQLLVSGSIDGTVAISRVEAGRLEKLLAMPFGTPVEALALSPDGVTLGVLLTGERAVRLIPLDQLDREFAASRLGIGVPARSMPNEMQSIPPPISDPATWPEHALRREVFADEVYRTKIAEGPDAVLDHDWKEGAPLPGAPVDHFSVRWTGCLVAPPGKYRFRLSADDRSALWLDSQRVAWSNRDDDPTRECGVALTGRPQRFQIDFAEYTRDARLRVEWALQPEWPQAKPAWEVVPPGVLYHRLADAERGAARLPRLAWSRQVDGTPNQAVFAPDGSVVVVVQDGQAIQCHVLKGAGEPELAGKPVTFAGRLIVSQLSPDGSLVAVLTEDRARIRVWRTADGVFVREWRGPPGSLGGPSWPSVSEPSAIAFSVGPNRWVQWTPTTNALALIPSPRGYSGDGLRYLRGETRIWSRQVDDPRFPHGGRTLTVSNPNGVREIPLGSVGGMSVDPTGRWIAVARHGGSAGNSKLAPGAVRLIDLQTGTELFHVLAVPVITGVQFSPDSKRLLICGAAGTVQVWHLPELR